MNYEEAKRMVEERLLLFKEFEDFTINKEIREDANFDSHDIGYNEALKDCWEWWKEKLK